MSRVWKFTDLEFFVLWRRVDKEDDLPSPLVFTSRTAGHDDFVRECKRTEEELAARLDSRAMTEVLDTLAFPDIRIVVDGWGAQNFEDPKGCVRLVAGRKGEVGYVVKQLPGETIWHSAGFVVSECDAVDLAKAVVDEIPPLEAGKLTGIVLPADKNQEVEHHYGASLVEDSFDDSIGYRYQQFIEAPATTAGTIAIVQGRSRFGPRGITRHEIQWRDLVDDGRYAITDDLPPCAVGADAARLTAMINTRIAAVIGAIKDERL
ncbi:ESX secretion-associated protein EspG [Nocardia amikacinitolerans]|uniref:ESX secretion-associated protein EspG n=1 Tax=Nocardia amikacinitolerans TaxID=756689 RepID=UPI0020A4C16C|nr:ESX secretion-associated protein EspG [Nocardia amikacinitolerans]MCP2289325.1 EspG family protein [Nocardia amikacinitolerans]